MEDATSVLEPPPAYEAITGLESPVFGAVEEVEEEITGFEGGGWWPSISDDEWERFARGLAVAKKARAAKSPPPVIHSAGENDRNLLTWLLRGIVYRVMC